MRSPATRFSAAMRSARVTGRRPWPAARQALCRRRPRRRRRGAAAPRGRCRFGGRVCGLLRRQAELLGVGRQEHVGAHRLQRGEGAAVVVGDPRVLRPPGDAVQAHAERALVHDVQRAAALRRAPGPGGVAGAVAGRQVRGQGLAAEADRVAVVQHAVDVDGLEAHRRVALLADVGPGLELVDVAVHGGELRAGVALELRHAARVIEVGVAVQQPAHLMRVVAEGADVLLHLRREARHAHVDQDQAVARGDKERADARAADLVDVADHVERRGGRAPRGRPAELHGRGDRGARRQHHGGGDQDAASHEEAPAATRPPSTRQMANTRSERFSV